MKPDTKKAAALIIALGKKPKSEAPESGEGYEESEEGEMDEGKLACADDIISALDNKDPEALAKALDAFLDLR